ncbi:MAG TPA: ATP-binding cassette domain-containing protein [Anaerolineaceae bacterium]|nr:ATP-binding cassette domain-containing protein [Anaerolineaceae bacterium]
MSAIISVKNLQKTFRVARRRTGAFGALRGLISPEYRTVHAVDGVSFNLEPGELVGYLGPNGAGKSTTLKILTGLLVPSGGEVWVNGMVPWKERTRYVAQIGAVFGQRSTLWYDLPVLDSFELLQPMYRIPMERYRRNLAEFSELLELEPFLHSPVRSLSLGQRMRADLCAALMHEPRLVFLDEPTIGLDVVAKERIRQFIQHIHKERGTTIILTTHDLSDIERLCERVMILDHGRLLYDGGLDSLVERFEGPRWISVTFAEEYTEVDLPGLPAQRHEGRRAAYAYDWRQTSASQVIARLLENFRIADLEVERPQVEETIRRIYEQRLLEN